MTTPTFGPPRLHRRGLTVLRGVSEGALWGTAAGAVFGSIVVMAFVAPVALSNPILAVYVLVMGAGFGVVYGVVYGVVAGIACGWALTLGRAWHRTHDRPYTLDRQQVLGGITGAVAAGLTGLALYGLDLAKLLPFVEGFQGAVGILIIVPALAAGAAMALRAPAIVRAGYVTTPPTGRPTSGPAPLAEPPTI